MSETQRKHEQYMQQALQLALQAAEHHDVPVGCVIVRDNIVVGKGANQIQLTGIPTQHAEIVAIEDATRAIGNKFLDDCTLYVTLEPCLMCAGAIVLARIPTVVYAASDAKTGAVRSVFEMLENKHLNHTCVVRTGILEAEASEMLSAFFADKRKAAPVEDNVGTNVGTIAGLNSAVTGTLWLVPTPLGNLDDVTKRALITLREADIILCEDTRRTGQLLRHYGIIPKRLMSNHDHNERQRSEYIPQLLQEGKSIALVSDAGMPTISDPGYRTVEACVAKGCKVVALPGGTAAITAVAASGLPTNKIYFAGFPPQKKGRATFLKEVLETPATIVFYESPHRVHQLVSEIQGLVSPLTKIVLARELTKMHEEFIRGTAAEVEKVLSDRGGVKGECVVLVSNTAVEVE